ncbi:MAG: LCP family protein [Lachnospiraceae bacterium]|nr:LCP family protein [Lachnospiraceae bacterium]
MFLITLVLGAIYLFYAREKGKKSLLKGNQDAVISAGLGATTDDNGHTVTYNGNTYKYNTNLASIVILGIDESELTNKEGTAGTADAVYIFTFDTKTSKCSLITVNRDTMVDVHLRSKSGKDMGYEKMQLAASYAYGDGRESSCENTMESLSRIFYNIPFNNYVALSWDAIAPLNDKLDGITVKCLEDVHTSYSDFKKGDTIELHGKDAWSYVKYRNTEILESNPLRLSRQKQYIKAYVDKLLPKVKNDFRFAGQLYDVAKPYMCTTLTRDEVIYIASEIAPSLYSTKDINFVSIDGKITLGGDNAEFTPDEQNLYETILKVFYIKQD